MMLGEVDLEKTEVYLNHCYDGINLLFGDTYHKIFYDSFSRIYYCEKASEALKKEVDDSVIYCEKIGEFNLGWALNNIFEKKNESLIKVFWSKFNLIKVENKFSSTIYVDMKTENHIKEKLTTLGILSKKIKCEKFTSLLIMKLLTNKIEMFNDTGSIIKEEKLIDHARLASLKVLQYNLAIVLNLKNKNESEKIVKSLYFDAISPSNLATLSKILGFKNNTFKKIYYQSIPGNFYITNMLTMKYEKIFEEFYENKCTVEQFRDLHMLDRIVCKNSLINVEKTFIEEVFNERKKMYLSENVSIKMIIYFFKNKKIKSVLSEINFV